MKDRLCLLFCDYFQAEVEWLVKSADYKEIKVLFYQADCDKTQQSSHVLDTLIQRTKTDSVIIFAGACLQRQLQKITHTDFQIEPLEICFELLLPSAQLQQVLAAGGHLLTNGMLKHWEQVKQNWGFSAQAQKDFFAETTRKLVFLSHPEISVDEIALNAVATELDLPLERLEISLEPLALRILTVINQWRSKLIADKKRQLADYAMVNDLISQIASIREERQVIQQVLELFHIFCEPSGVCYLPILNSQQTGELIFSLPVADKEQERQRLLAVEKSYLLDKSQAGFQLLVKHNEEKVGVFGVYGVAFPQYLNHYLNLARNIAPVIALAISNARIYQLQVSAQQHIQQLNSDLENQLDTVNNLNRELESFTYTVSHDLREPLTVLDKFVQILLRDYREQLDERGQNFLNRISHNSKRMAELIEDLLRLSRLTRAELQLQPVDLSQIARALAADLQQAEPTRQVQFEIADNLTVQADPSLIKVVLENLLGNAWKYTRYQKPALITIDQYVEQGKTIFRMQDNGAGFDMAHAELLFAPFRRLHTAEQFPGTGIGLATVQRIIQRHGGKIWATAVPNQGACFCFTLPPFA